MQQVGVRAWIPALSEATVGQPARLLWVWIFLGFAVRATLALLTVGTNDVLSWRQFMMTIHETDWVQVYHVIRDYNHPPPMSLYLQLIYPWVAIVPNGFSLLIRLPAIFADVGTALIVFKLGSRLYDGAFGSLAAMVACLSPLLILVSGFHGNTDPVFVFLFLLAAERAIVAKWRFRAGLILGASLGIKIVPVMLFPLFFFWLPTWKERVRFFAAVALMAVAIFGYHAYVDFPILSRNVLGYDSTHGVWGYTQWLAPLGLWPTFMRLPAKLLLIGAITFAVFRHTRGRQGDSKTLLEGIALTFLTFLVFSPGFGIQYLVWFAVPALFLRMPREAARFHFWSGLLAFSAYNHWCHGEPILSLAGSVRWNPWEMLLCFILWAGLIQWLVRFSRRPAA